MDGWSLEKKGGGSSQDNNTIFRWQLRPHNSLKDSFTIKLSLEKILNWTGNIINFIFLPYVPTIFFLKIRLLLNQSQREYYSNF